MHRSGGGDDSLAPVLSVRPRRPGGALNRGHRT